jgi:protein-S-isoprenylcysteine O-methyltransferase Ste14
MTLQAVTPIRVARWLAFVMISGAVSLALVGRADVPRLWVFLGLYWAVGLCTLALLDPEVVRERLRRGQKTADPVILAALRIFSLGQVVVGMLDVGRFHWSDTVPPLLSLAALVATSLGFALILSAIMENRFFIPGVRIQSERGHRLVDTGPYRHMRHPGYTGMTAVSLGSSLVLGSWLGFVFGVVAGGVFVIRAWREDRFLKANLPGYPEYAARTRFRLVPGVW